MFFAISPTIDDIDLGKHIHIINSFTPPIFLIWSSPIITLFRTLWRHKLLKAPTCCYHSLGNLVIPIMSYPHLFLLPPYHAPWQNLQHIPPIPLLLPIPTIIPIALIILKASTKSINLTLLILPSPSRSNGKHHHFFHCKLGGICSNLCITT